MSENGISIYWNFKETYSFASVNILLHAQRVNEARVRKGPMYLKNVGRSARKAESKIPKAVQEMIDCKQRENIVG